MLIRPDIGRHRRHGVIQCACGGRQTFFVERKDEGQTGKNQREFKFEVRQ